MGLLCLALCIYGIVLSWGYYDDFKTASDLIDDSANTCTTFTAAKLCQCSPTSITFDKEGYTGKTLFR